NAAHFSRDRTTTSSFQKFTSRDFRHTRSSHEAVSMPILVLIRRLSSRAPLNADLPSTVQIYALSEPL
ncbi:MAG: hypothetical protein ABL898_17630, partial [Hyphomicrobiaceae bacterium]